ncbi:phosphotransferase [Nocardiopsis sp. HNM0947]|uniref:Phosphotransferase n=1 Tax=Nocardiopsis coralli TaxID=2772213 RepID=A0ABR9P3K9_9ACTN|nr:phosphotransferase [Nocardiopsis coralli]MBE2998408.1 phosphotransferase [Nocardiopsis coralli]
MVDGEGLRGGVNVVRRSGDRVHRPSTAATPTIHRLLAHLRARGFAGAPTPLGRDAQGDEVLSFLPGEVPGSLPPRLRSERLLGSAGALLRGLHDASASFGTGPEDRWQVAPRAPREVICHGDIAPYNSVVRDGRVVGFIDFDTAHPGPRLWDLAHAAYRFAPLHAPDNPDSLGDIADQAGRVVLLCRAYGREPDGALLDAVVERLRWTIEHMREQADRGSTAFQEHISDGHIDLYREDIAHIRAHFSALTRSFDALGAGGIR